MLKKLRETLDNNKKEYIKKLKELVAIDTQVIGHGIDGGLEKKGQEYLGRLFEEMGAQSIEEHYLTEEIIQKGIKEFNEGNPGHNYENRYNLYAKFGGKGNKSIMFNGHIDTMPPGDISTWSSHPHKPEVRDGKLYGLGACDMKGGLMAAILAVDLLKKANIELPGDVIISSVVDEEGGGNGSIAAAIHGQKADAVVVCEPTNYELILAHMGFVFFQVEVEGLAVHSGSKWLGVNAIEKANKLLRAIDELEHKWMMVHKHELLPPPSSNVGVIEGGTAGSTVPDYCSFKTCVHYLPSMNYKDVLEEYIGAINRACEGDEWLKDHKPKITIYQAGGPFEMDRDDSLVKSFSKSFKVVKEEEVNIVGSPAGCDSRVWKNIANCPTIQYGPGAQAQCHAIDEFIGIDQYLDAILIYAMLILEWNNI